MSHRRSDRSRTVTHSRKLLAAMICGSLLASPGCKVPCLRGPAAGPVMPPAYNWNNGRPFWSPAVAGAADRSPDAVIVAPTRDAAKKDADDDADDVDDDEADAGTDDADGADLDDRSSVAPDDASDRGSISRFLKPVSYLQDDEPAAAGQSDDQPELLDTDVLDASQEVEAEDELMKEADDRSEPTDSNGLSFSTTDIDFGLTSMQNSAQLPIDAFFTDPYLLGLISQALVGNQELRILYEEIQIAQNETYARSGAYRPFVTLGGGAGVEKSGRHTRAGAVEEQLSVAPGRGFPDPLPNFLAAANVSWELDIWHRLRNSQRAAAMRYLGTQEGRTFTITRLVAEIAENYYQLLALDNRLATLDQTIEIQRQSLTVAQAKKEAGEGTELAVQRFQAEVRKNQSERSLIQQQIVEVENEINFLAGRYPQPVERVAGPFIELNLQALAAGVPSQILQNRADIREAERLVAAAGLDVQVARARFYPALVLSGGLGWNAFATGYLFRTPESLIYSLTGDLVGPLINKRAIQADYATANAEQLQAIYNYQQTVLEAHIEVVNQISRVENLRRSIDVKKQQIDSLVGSVDTATKLFQGGRAEYVEVLLAQREAMEARMELIDTKQEQLSAIVNAYQALGGGGF